VVDLVAEDGPPERLVVTHADPAKAAWARELERRYPPAADPANVVSRVFLSGTSELATDIPDAFLAANARDPEHLRILRALGIRSHMIVPLIARGRTLGALTFVAAESGRRYGPGDLALAEDLAHRAAVAVDNARLYRDLQEAERRKDESLALLDTLFATAPVGLGFWDRDLRYVRINDALAAINGPPATAHLGRTLEEMIPQLAPEVRGLFQRVLATGEPIVGLEMGGETPRAPGERRHWLTDYFPVRGHDGAALGIGAVVTEITERKRAEQERADLLARERAARAEAEAAQGRLAFLAEASALLAASLDYRTTLENVARLAVPHLADWCVIDIVEEDGRITPLATAHGDPARLALVAGLRERFPDLANPTEGVRNVLRTGEPELVPALSADYRGGSPRAEAFLAAIRELGLVSYMVVPLLARGRACGAITFAAAESGRHYGPADLALAGDLARRAAVAVDNARLYREAQEAVRARDQFLTIAAHELRTPITAVRGNAELLLRRVEREDRPLDREWLAVRLQRLIAGTDRLHALAARVLDLNRLQAGVLDLQPAPCDLAALVAGVVERTRLARLPGTGSTLTLRRPEGPVLGAWDPLRIEQVVANLLDNAVKYQPAGGEIAVEVAATADEAVVRVRDQGIGIAAGDLPRLFAPFARADTATSSQIAGVGVGLYIADQIARLHGGSIAVTSDVGAGSEFVVRLPRRGAGDGRAGE
ncbi:MAG TPA: ATP-binding protein, partial [Thermomicrobiales bacterium]|nr:ATP-binding protein [Thermomicrobiales bacterium]